MATIIGIAVLFGFAVAVLGFGGLAGMAFTIVMTSFGGRVIK